MKYIWLKNGKPWKETEDIEGNHITTEFFPNNVEIHYRLGLDKKPYQEAWYKNDLVHRDGDKPARINYSGYDDKRVVVVEAWFQYGKKHRELTKPARIDYDGKGTEKRNILFERGYTEGDKKWVKTYRNGELRGADGEFPIGNDRSVYIESYDDYGIVEWRKSGDANIYDDGKYPSRVTDYGNLKLIHNNWQKDGSWVEDGICSVEFPRNGMLETIWVARNGDFHKITINEDGSVDGDTEGLDFQNIMNELKETRKPLTYNDALDMAVEQIKSYGG